MIFLKSEKQLNCDPDPQKKKKKEKKYNKNKGYFGQVVDKHVFFHVLMFLIENYEQ